MSEPRTVAAALARIAAQEELCAERYGAIRETIAELKGAVHSAGKMLAGLALALLAWGASQIYADLKAARAPEAPPVTAAPLPGGPAAETFAYLHRDRYQFGP